MDSRPVSYTSPSNRESSRIYQDLEASRSISPSISRRRHQKPPIMGDCIEHNVLPSPKKPHIGIIGAGVSGLRCADILLSRGFEVTIIEARDRVGGRIHQVKLPGTEHLVDVGPNWIHGTDSNPILDIAYKTDTTTHRWDEKSQIYDQDGKLLSEKEAGEYNDIFWKIVVDAFKYSQNVLTIAPKRSLFDYFKMKIETIIPDSNRGSERKQRILLQMSERWGAFIGSRITNQSLKFFWLEECIEGENLFCAGTFQRILERIAKPTIGNAKIQLSTKVVQVITSDEKFGEVTLLTNKGESLVFDDVVITAPLGWLKKNLDVFEPPLSLRLCQAINSIGYGCLEKIYISFPEAFWLHTDSSDKTKCLPSCKSEKGHTGFTQWLSPTYSYHNPHGWAQQTVDLSTLPESCAHPTLLFYIFGEQSQALSDALSAFPSQGSRHTFLSAYFEPYYSLLPHYDSSKPSCQASSSFATNWYADDLAGNGSYSNFQVGLEEGDKHIEAMREGCPERGLWFAGEHTSAFVASGTVTGAYWSGEAVGNKIAATYGVREGTHVKTKG